jgi:hypothetical protein
MPKQQRETNKMDFKTDENYEDGANDFGKSNFSLLEKGVYRFVIGKAEIKQTKAGDGNYLNLMFQVVEGDREKTCIFKMFMLSSPKQVAVEIGKKQLAGLTKALSIAHLTDEQSLIGKECWGEVYISKGKNGYPDSNDISAFKSPDWRPEEFDEPKTGDFTYKDGMPF